MSRNKYRIKTIIISGQIRLGYSRGLKKKTYKTFRGSRKKTEDQQILNEKEDL